MINYLKEGKYIFLFLTVLFITVKQTMEGFNKMVNSLKYT